MRDEMPTLLCDLSEFARVHTGPFSWTDDAPFDDEPLDEIVSGPLIGLMPTDIPRVAVSTEECMRHAIDHREGFVLSLLDGCSNVETLVDIAGLPEPETLGVLCELCARGLIVFVRGPLA